MNGRNFINIKNRWKMDCIVMKEMYKYLNERGQVDR